MASINNPHYLSKMYNAALSVTPNAEDQIEDGVDNPHTGLIKALSLIARGNHAVKRTNGFDITTNNATQFAVTTGKFYRDGKLLTATNSGSPFTLTYGGAAFPALVSSEGVYFLLVVDAANALVVRSPNPAAINKIPTHQAGDVIIAIIGYTGTASDGSELLVQFLTTDKTTNSVSIGYEASNQYEEAGSITGTTNGLFISGIGTATAAADDKVIIQDTGSADVIKTVRIDSLGALSGAAVLTGNTNNTITTVTGANAIQGEANLTFDGTTLANTGSYTATGGLDTGLAVNAGTSLSSATTTTVGTVLTANQGVNTNGYYKQSAFGILDDSLGRWAITGSYSYIFIHDMALAPAGGGAAPNSIVLPPATNAVNRILTLKNIGPLAITITPQVGENFDASTATGPANPAVYTAGSTVLSAINVITLHPLQSVTLWAAGAEGAMPPPLAAGWYIMQSSNS